MSMLSLSRAILLQLLLGVGTLLLFLIALECGLRLKRAMVGVDAIDSHALRSFVSTYPSAAPDILALKRNHTSRWKTDEFDILVETDGSGFRQPNHSQLSTAEVLVMGDSFTFGHGVQGDQRYGVRLGTLAKKRTLISSYNNGWAPPHYLKWFMMNQPLAPNHIVVGLYLGNDLFSDIRETVLLEGGADFVLPFRTVTRNGELGNSAPLRYSFLEWLRRNSRFCEWLMIRLVSAGYQEWFQFVSPGDGALVTPNAFNPASLDRGMPSLEAAAAFGYLERLAKVCRARNATCSLHVLLIPQNFLVYDVPQRSAHTRLSSAEQQLVRHGGRSILTYALEACVEHGLDCINPIEALRRAGGASTYFERDGHWTPLGHNVAAQALCERVSWCR